MDGPLKGKISSNGASMPDTVTKYNASSYLPQIGGGSGGGGGVGGSLVIRGGNLGTSNYQNDIRIIENNNNGSGEVSGRSTPNSAQRIRLTSAYTREVPDIITNSATAEVFTLRQRIQSLENELTYLRRNSDNNGSREVLSLEVSLRNKDAAMASMENEIVELRDAAQKYANDKWNWEETFRRLQAENANLYEQRMRVEGLEGTIGELEHRLVQSKEREEIAYRLEEEVSELRRQLRDQHKSVEEIQERKVDELAEADKKVASLRDELSALKLGGDRKERETQGLEREVEALRNRLDATKVEAEQVMQVSLRAQEAEGRVESLLKELWELNESLTAQTNSMETLRAEADQRKVLWDMEKHSLQTEIREMKRTAMVGENYHSQLKEEQKRRMSFSKSILTCITDTTLDLAGNGDTPLGLGGSLSSSSVNNNACDDNTIVKRVNFLVEENKRLTGSIKELHISLNSVQSEKHNAEVRLAQLAAELHASEVAKREFEDGQNARIQALENAEKENLKTLEQVDLLIQQLGASEDTVVELKSANREAAIWKDHQRVETVRIEGLVDELRGELGEKKERINLLNAKVARMDSATAAATQWSERWRELCVMVSSVFDVNELDPDSDNCAVIIQSKLRDLNNRNNETMEALSDAQKRSRELTCELTSVRNEYEVHREKADNDKRSLEALQKEFQKVILSRVSTEKGSEEMLERAETAERAAQALQIELRQKSIMLNNLENAVSREASISSNTTMEFQDQHIKIMRKVGALIGILLQDDGMNTSVASYDVAPVISKVEDLLKSGYKIISIDESFVSKESPICSASNSEDNLRETDQLPAATPDKSDGLSEKIQKDRNVFCDNQSSVSSISVENDSVNEKLLERLKLVENAKISATTEVNRLTGELNRLRQEIVQMKEKRGHFKKMKQSHDEFLGQLIILLKLDKVVDLNIHEEQIIERTKQVMEEREAEIGRRNNKVWTLEKRLRKSYQTIDHKEMWIDLLTKKIDKLKIRDAATKRLETEKIEAEGKWRRVAKICQRLKKEAHQRTAELEEFKFEYAHIQEERNKMLEYEHFLDTQERAFVSSSANYSAAIANKDNLIRSLKSRLDSNSSGKEGLQQDYKSVTEEMLTLRKKLDNSQQRAHKYTSFCGRVALAVGLDMKNAVQLTDQDITDALQSILRERDMLRERLTRLHGFMSSMESGVQCVFNEVIHVKETIGFNESEEAAQMDDTIITDVEHDINNVADSETNERHDKSKTTV